ncbi:MAG: class I SAM-dependent methyltransferase [Methanomassiliicoccales archaeon]|nr:class I SAM-dependent methyltransferase [Methanomassiliicoccales archaeon]
MGESLRLGALLLVEMSITEPSRREQLGVLLFSKLGRWVVYKPFVDRIGLKGDERVLDFGSGWGDVTYFVSRVLTKGGSIVLMDVSSIWQDVAKKRLKKIKGLTFVHSDVFGAGFPDGSFDAIVIHYVLHDIAKEKRGAIIAEMAKKLRPGGYIYINEPVAKQHGMPPEEIIDLMTSAGLTMTPTHSNKRTFEARFTKSAGGP